MKILLLLALSISSFATEYCIVEIEEISLNQINIIKHCDGESSKLFKNHYIYDNAYFPMVGIERSQPSNQVLLKAESFTAKVFLNQGFQIVDLQRSKHSVKLTVIK